MMSNVVENTSYSPSSLEASSMAVVVSNLETSDLLKETSFSSLANISDLQPRDLSPLLQKEVNAYMMLEGEFTVSSGEVEVMRKDGGKVSGGMSEWCSARFFPFLLDGEKVRIDWCDAQWQDSLWFQSRWQVQRNGAHMFDFFPGTSHSVQSDIYTFLLPQADQQVRVMETLEGGKLVTRHWVRWNKEDGKEVLSEKRSELWIGRDGGLVWRYTVPGCYSEDGVEVEVDIRSTHKAPRVNSKLTYEARGF